MHFIVHTLDLFSKFFYYYKNLHYRFFCCYADKWQINVRPNLLLVFVMCIQPETLTERSGPDTKLLATLVNNQNIDLR